MDKNKITKIFILIMPIILGLLVVTIIVFLSKAEILNRELILGQNGNLKQAEEENSNLEMTYLINSQTSTTINITVIAESKIGIEEVITPDGLEINSAKDRTKLAVDYNINLNQEYIFKVKQKGDSEIKEYTLLAKQDDKPIIDEANSPAYPLLDLYGVRVNKKIEIDYGDATQKYYSLDNGTTWEQYTDIFSVHEACTIMAKIKTQENTIQRISKKDIKINLASDALPMVCYNGNDSDYTSFSNTEKNRVDIDSTAIGKSIAVKWGVYGNLYFYNQSGSQVSSVTCTVGYGSTPKTEKITIPNNAAYMVFAGGSSDNRLALYEVKLADEPTIKVAEIHYPKLTTSGIEKPYNVVKIEYLPTIVKKYYKIGDGSNWIEYNGEQIEVLVGNTIYAKGINSEGKETRITSTYESKIDDALPMVCYNGNDNDYINFYSKTKYRVDIDSNVIGKNMSVKWNIYGTVYFYNNSGTQLSSVACTIGYGSGPKTEKITIPNNAAYMVFEGGSSSPLTLYEVKFAK